MRHPEPDSVTNFKRMVAIGPPRCCHTCEFYDVKGTCVVFFMEPPKEFAETHGECADYEREIPF